MKNLFIGCAVTLCLCSMAFGGQKSVVQLNDGSTISAEVLSLANGVYTLASDSLGEVRINASRIRAIESGPGASSPTENNPLRINDPAVQSQMNSMATRMMSDPQIIQILTGMLNDPEIQKILNDPDIRQALNSGDIQSLISNEKIKDLMSHPKVLEVQSKMKTRVGQ